MRTARKQECRKRAISKADIIPCNFIINPLYIIRIIINFFKQSNSLK